MVEERRVRNEASNIAADAVKTRGLSDVESECLRDLLASDEAFGALVTAQQNAVLLDVDDHDINKDLQSMAAAGANRIGDAIHWIIDQRTEQAEAIVALAHRGPDVLSWTWALELYQGGFETIEDICEADQETLVAETDMSPISVSKLTAHLDDWDDAEKQEVQEL
jgi:hypothetical protein